MFGSGKEYAGVDRVDIKVLGGMATIKMRVDRSLPAGTVKVAKQGRGNMNVTTSGDRLTIDVSPPSIKVKNTGNATATGGGSANTGIDFGGGSWSNCKVAQNSTAMSSRFGPTVTVTMAAEVLYRTHS